MTRLPVIWSFKLWTVVLTIIQALTESVLEKYMLSARVVFTLVVSLLGVPETIAL